MFVLIRGAGDIATGVAMRLWYSHIKVVMTDVAKPTCIRRTVAFSDAIYHGKTTVEGVTAARAETVAEALEIIERGEIPVLVDPEGNCRHELCPDALVDAILAKKNLGTAITDAPLVIGVGPGFTAQVDCHAVIETIRGHYMGRVIKKGAATPNTNIPGFIGGFSGERILRAPCDGVFTQTHEIGDMVEEGDICGTVNGEPVRCTIGGVVRGILPSGTPVYKGMKSGDVDPRGDVTYCDFVSDKALAVGGGVLEAILGFTATLRE